MHRQSGCAKEVHACVSYVVMANVEAASTRAKLVMNSWVELHATTPAVAVEGRSGGELGHRLVMTQEEDKHVVSHGQTGATGDSL